MIDREKLLPHLMHDISIFTYGEEAHIADVTIECTECSEIIYSEETSLEEVQR